MPSRLENNGAGMPDIPPDLKGRAVRGGLVTIVGQGVKFGLRAAYLIALARLLLPEDFGLVGMVTALTGCFNLLKEAGLSSASVQSKNIAEDEISSLFWINLGIGFSIFLLFAVSAPAVSAFYGESRLSWITVALGSGFIFSGLGVQHNAILERRLRFVSMTTIEISALALSSFLAIGMAFSGWSYWALVAGNVSTAIFTTGGAWLATRWIPKWPSRKTRIAPLLRFGGLFTCNNLIVYLAYNVDKILLGRFWGPGPLGIYGRAYNLITLPTNQLNSAVGRVAFPTFARLQGDLKRLRMFFLKSYTLLVTLTVPITIISTAYADDIVLVLLGPKWSAAGQVLRFFAPTALAFGLINPFGWLLSSTGRVGRSLAIACLIAPLVIAGYAAGLPYGAPGVALGFSAVMILLIVPVIAWSKIDMGIRASDVWGSIRAPFFSGAVSGLVAFAANLTIGNSLSPPERLLLGISLSFGIYAALLVFPLGQRELYKSVLLAAIGRGNLEMGLTSK